jgi:NAD(P)H-dependent FMN reductase
MQKLTIGVLIGSTRDGRFSVYPAQWIIELGSTHERLAFELVDLRNYKLPFLTDSVNPSKMNGIYPDAEVMRFAECIKKFDGYIIVTPEYNHAYPAVLKNAIDHIKSEWARKPVAFISYGTVGGARAVEQLRQVMIDFETVPLKNALHIIAPWMLRETDGSLKAGALDSYVKSGEGMLDQLSWWTQTLKQGRAE